MNKKPKILVSSESSKISSGFGVYNKYLLEGLYNTGKYEIAEFASYGLIGDKEKFNIPWKYYPNGIQQNDPRQQQFAQSTENHFGKWRFDRVILDFKPDIVIDIRDYWMSSYQQKSPLRKYFHWILMPTIDSSPQQDEWLDTYINANAIFTYSEWGRDVLINQTSNNINFINVASPCADLSVFNYDSNKNSIKSTLGLNPNSVIVGTVMRNQKRKLFPELIETFEKIVEESIKNNYVFKNDLILYLHTSYPDAGWDIPNLIKNSKVSNRIFFTYNCKKCGRVFASNFSGIVQYCSLCNTKSATIPNVSNGVSSSVLSKIMNIFDLYIQYSICEGFGMPQIEAAACGVPVFTMDYSAMKDIIKNIKAEPIKIGTYFKELETSAIRTYPDHNDTIQKVVSFLNMPNQLRQRKGFYSSEIVKKQYNWKTTVDKWIEYIDTIDYSKYKEKWTEPEYIIPLLDINSLPKSNTIYGLVYLIQENYLSKLGISMDNYWLLKQIQMVQDGHYCAGAEIKPYSLNDLIQNLNIMITNHNNAEMARTNSKILKQEDFIDYANQQ